ncbi:beta-1,3-galactosyl-O-glycosyl-glycoprotein beta-1,6-N-acetylglucosaminyltransferase-like [Mytilus galloprovincialis]|uniref:beta-1,3-galactosyl-O-glycosyl-glycoprotein beta-1,6-N-acetylglucosaminyltransferase-like n=1 Tax=Mytilus galloprovincialis TaxID=29158 RepID=UPI003F7C9B4D
MKTKWKTLFFCIGGFSIISMFSISNFLQVYLSLYLGWKVNCRNIIHGDKDEILKALQYMKYNSPIRLLDKDFVNIATNCSNFLEIFGYNIYPITDEERHFPIAFSILTFKDADQTQRLLHSIYRPQNFYCIHVDTSSSSYLHEAFLVIAKCFKNVFIVTKTENIIYKHISRLKADINCMSDLLMKSQKWKYFINLPHQQFPLKTNLELVKILKIYNGANDIEGITSPNRMVSERYMYSYKNVNNSLVRIGLKNDTMPFNASIFKGSAYGIFSRKFVQYVLFDQRAKAVLEYMEDIMSPDEYYWATLNHNEILQAPGRFTGNPEKKSWLAVYAAWDGTDQCNGKFVRDICIFGVGDLKELVTRKELFANKFYPDFQYLGLECLEEYINNKTLNPMRFDSFYYKQLSFIKKT